MKEKIPFYNEKEFHDMVKKTKKGTFSGWYIINKNNNSVEFSGSFNRQFKLNKPVIPVNTEYVTRKEFNEYKDSNDQRLTKIETELKSQGQRIQVVEDKVDRLTEVVMVQSQQIKTQGEAMNARMDRFESLVLKSLESIGNTLTDFGKRLDVIETRLDKIDPPK
ncbi:DUF16 domain-containing protein [Mycoplasmoides pneumoniae]|uniref:UPF0134 protein MPN_139 n=2 Tax=Mycoplasmoides pneumoniae TaxID=2104 RepID=Y139_MYCPN|nr:DUF16 domain-containing protein [Mycoplasmoides pneumoniae]P75259.1 RecName: Full=UPF0134 protein MPN_139 [Mycoplasmoides pneumoniae M129]AAB95663.1 hypothetical protein MPN_139 [Mycoplasmoides pneumoniae M129]ABR53876.1 hypothetical protein MPN139 [Mycoplasmoides pneumoniae]AGC04068.1 hypothetical protein C985_0140 [Mycoplasmoides pneumoniae M129-B7]ALA30025.1 hypothetical protein C897_00830 [Mycoplasmoides pneumoniae PI 1428]ALA32138.1 hypothetical protein F533_00835 [Mycoplasmoides pneu